MRYKIFYYLKLVLAAFAIEQMSDIFQNTSANPINKSSSLPFEDCGSEYDVVYLGIAGCKLIPCLMKRNSTVKITVFFEDKGSDISFLKHQVHWIINYVYIEALIAPDPCDGKNECIANVNNGKTYWANIYVNESLALTRGLLLWETVDKGNKKLVCFQVPIVLTM